MSNRKYKTIGWFLLFIFVTLFLMGILSHNMKTNKRSNTVSQSNNKPFPSDSENQKQSQSSETNLEEELDEDFIAKEIDKTVNVGYFGQLGNNNLGHSIIAEIAQILFQKRGRVHGLDVRFSTTKNSREGTASVIPSSDIVIFGGGSLFRHSFMDNGILPEHHESQKLFLFGTGFSDNVNCRFMLSLTALKRLYFQNNENNVHNKSNSTAVNKVMENLPSISSELNRLGSFLYKIKHWDTYGGVRGYGTQRLIKTIEPNLSLDVIGDAGIIAAQVIRPTSRELPSRMLSWIVDNQGEYVVFNAGAQPARNYGCHDPDRLQEFQLELAKRILARGHSIFILPTHSRDVPTVHTLQSKLLEFAENSTLPVSPDSIVSSDRLFSASQVMAIYRSAKFSVNYKLHGNIFSAAVKKPFVGIAYRQKTLDFAQYMESLDYIRTTHDINHLDVWENMIERLEDEKERERIASVFEEKIKHTWQKYESAVDNTLVTLKNEREAKLHHY